MSLHHIPKHLPTLSQILDDLSRPAPHVWSRVVGVSERTARRWEAADQAPRAVLLALFWVTRWGYSEVISQAMYELDLARGLAAAYRRENAALQARMTHLQAIGNFGASNDPLVEIVQGGPRPGPRALPP
jgi:hypothetical protein